MKKKIILGCGKQCLVDGEKHLQCGEFEIKNNKLTTRFLCHECIDINETTKQRKV